MYNFQLVNLDTDSISVCKPDGAEFTEQEQERLLEELNLLMPEKIKWEDDGFYSSVVVIKAKNYVLKEHSGKIKIKGSALKATMKENALKEFIKCVIEYLLDDKKDCLIDLYNSYVKEIYNLEDITRWSFKKTITEKVINPERTNEQKVLDAIEGEEFQEGDKIFVYFDRNGNLKLQEKWSNDHDPEKLLTKLYSTIKIFDTVIDVSQFPKYHLKNHNIKCQLSDLLGLPHPEKEKRTRKKKELDAVS
jgi:hypothetical protein